MKNSLDEARYHVIPVLDLPLDLRISTVIGYLRKLESLLTQSGLAKSHTAAELALRVRDFISSSSLSATGKEVR
jgi:hypothetical protein